MHTKNQSVFSNITIYTVYTLLLGFPLLFFPITQNVFDTPKLLFLSLITFFLIVTWSIKTLFARTLTFTLHPFLLPLSLSIVSIFLSVVLNREYLIEVLPSMAGITLLFIAVILFGSTLIKSVKTTQILDLTQALTIVLTLISILQIFGVGPTLLINALFSLPLPNTFAFSPTGSPLITLTVLLALQIPIIIDLILNKSYKENLFRVGGSILVALGILVHIFQLLPGKPNTPNLLPFFANWVIAIETFKSPLRALIGAGSQSFLDIFTIYKPVSLNTSPNWNIGYQTGSNTPLTLAVTSGLLGVFSWAYLFVQVIRTARKTEKKDVALPTIVLVSLLLQLLLPLNFILLAIQSIGLLFWIVTLKENNQAHEYTFHLSHALKQYTHVLLAISIAIVATVLSLSTAAGYFILRSSIAEYFFFQSLKAIQNNNGNQAYVAQQKTISWNPYKDSYRNAYAQTNFALANALSQKQDLTQEEQNTVARLVQQSIREGRAAVQLNPRRAENWKVLAQTYRSLLGSVEGADRFTLAAYVRAIQSAPSDPTLRIDLGGVYLQAENPQQAATLFQQAVQLKPDYANGYYNWAKALEQLERFDLAYQAYQKALENLDSSSDTYIQVQKEMSAIEQQAKEQAEKIQQQNTQAQPQNQKPQTTPTLTPAAEPTPTPPNPNEVPQTPTESELPEEVEQRSNEVDPTQELNVSSESGTPDQNN